MVHNGIVRPHGGAGNGNEARTSASGPMPSMPRRRRSGPRTINTTSASHDVAEVAQGSVVARGCWTSRRTRCWRIVAVKFGGRVSDSARGVGRSWRHRRGGAGARYHGCAVRAFQLARRADFRTSCSRRCDFSSVDTWKAAHRDPRVPAMSNRWRATPRRSSQTRRKWRWRPGPRCRGERRPNPMAEAARADLTERPVGERPRTAGGRTDRPRRSRGPEPDAPAHEP